MPKRQCLKDSKDIFWCYYGVFNGVTIIMTAKFYHHKKKP